MEANLVGFASPSTSPPRSILPLLNTFVMAHRVGRSSSSLQQQEDDDVLVSQNVSPWGHKATLACFGRKSDIVDTLELSGGFSPTVGFAHTSASRLRQLCTFQSLSIASLARMTACYVIVLSTRDPQAFHSLFGACTSTTHIQMPATTSFTSAMLSLSFSPIKSFETLPIRSTTWHTHQTAVLIAGLDACLPIVHP